MDTLTLSAFEAKHLAGAHRLSRAAGWPHRQEDWAMLLSLSQGATILDGDELIATALVTPMGPIATVNMIIVDEARRGAGLGRRVMEAAMSRISPREWRLVATKDGLPLYERMGFQADGEILQHQGVVRAPARAPALPPLARTGDLDALAELDHAATGMERRRLLATLLADGRIFVHREDGRIVAFAAQRHFGSGLVIGPVVARDLAEAQSLIEPLMAAADGQFLRIDTDADCGLADWLTAHGLGHVGGGVKMRKGVPTEPIGPQRRFALAAQSLY